MNSFGLVSIGLVLGLVVATLVVAIAAMIYLAWQQRSSIRSVRVAAQRLVAENTVAVDKLRTEVTMLLQQVDAERMYQASLGMQRGVRQLTETVAMLSKLVYASGAGAPESSPGPTISYPTRSMDADQTSAAGILGEDEADRIQAEQWLTRPGRSWPPVTGMAAQAAQPEPQQQPEALPPVHPLPDIHDAYSDDIADTTDL